MIARTILTAVPYVFCFLLALGIAVAIMMKRPVVEGFAVKDLTKIPWWAWIAMGLLWMLVVYLIADGDSLRSKIKQVASGRFGVTTEYLRSAITLSSFLYAFSIFSNSLPLLRVVRAYGRGCGRERERVLDWG